MAGPSPFPAPSPSKVRPVNAWITAEDSRHSAQRRGSPEGGKRMTENRTMTLRKTQLHASISDPVLDTMNFLNEITHRYPDATSFAPGRPYDGFFETDQIFTYLERYIAHRRHSGDSPARIRDALFQYGPTSGQIREIVCESLRKDENIHVPAESIVVTVGCQEATFLALRALFTG